jgi:hypothetical protein
MLAATSSLLHPGIAYGNPSNNGLSSQNNYTSASSNPTPTLSQQISSSSSQGLETTAPPEIIEEVRVGRAGEQQVNKYAKGKFLGKVSLFHSLLAFLLPKKSSFPN